MTNQILRKRAETAYQAAGYTIEATDRTHQQDPTDLRVSRAGQESAVLVLASETSKPGVVLTHVDHLTALAESVHIITTSARHATRLRSLLERPVRTWTRAGTECYTHPAPFTPDGNERTCTAPCVWVKTTEEQPAPVEPILSVAYPPTPDGDRQGRATDKRREIQFADDTTGPGVTQSGLWNGPIETGPRYGEWITEHDGRCPPAERPSLLRRAVVPQRSSYEAQTTIMVLDDDLTLTEDRPAKTGLEHVRSPTVPPTDRATPNSRPFTAAHLIPRTDWTSIVNTTHK